MNIMILYLRKCLLWQNTLYTNGCTFCMIIKQFDRSELSAIICNQESSQNSNQSKSICKQTKRYNNLVNNNLIWNDRFCCKISGLRLEQ